MSEERISPTAVDSPLELLNKASQLLLRVAQSLDCGNSSADSIASNVYRIVSELVLVKSSVKSLGIRKVSDGSTSYQPMAHLTQESAHYHTRPLDIGSVSPPFTSTSSARINTRDPGGATTCLAQELTDHSSSNRLNYFCSGDSSDKLKIEKHSDTSEVKPSRHTKKEQSNALSSQAAKIQKSHNDKKMNNMFSIYSEDSSVEEILPNYSTESADDGNRHCLTDSLSGACDSSDSDVSHSKKRMKQQTTEEQPNWKAEVKPTNTFDQSRQTTGNKIPIDFERKYIISIDSTDDEDDSESHSDFDKSQGTCSPSAKSQASGRSQNVFTGDDGEKSSRDLNSSDLNSFMDLWNVSLSRIGYRCTSDLEKLPCIRQASTKCKGTIQCNAMYGRIEFHSCQKIFDITGLKRNDIFLDIGHGIGNAPIQAAVTLGCEARGLELVKDRFFESCKIRDSIVNALKNTIQSHVIGKIDLRQGDLCAKTHYDFMTEADVVLVNNAYDIFSSRMQSRQNSATLDDYIAGIFAGMKPGSRMVTFSSLPLGHSLTDANIKRENKGKQHNPNASFFECRTESLGRLSASWTNNEMVVYIYTRSENSFHSREPMFICDQG